MVELNDRGGQLERPSTNPLSAWCPQSVRQVPGVYSPNPAPGPAAPAKPGRARPGVSGHVQDLVGLASDSGGRKISQWSRGRGALTSSILGRPKPARVARGSGKRRLQAGKTEGLGPRPAYARHALPLRGCGRAASFASCRI